MTRKALLITLVCCLFTNAFARKVKFSTDITNYLSNMGSIQYGGIYLELNANTDSTTYLLMSNEPGTNIYSLVIELYSNKLYRYKFDDGKEGYGREFVPGESRAICNSCDNDWNNDTIDEDNSRWIFVDSVLKPQVTSVAPTTVATGQTYTYSVAAKAVSAGDTLCTGAILFGENAPAGKYLLRFKVDMKYQPVSSAGVHVAGSFQGWDLNNMKLYSFPVSNDPDYDGVLNTYTTSTYEGIVFVDPGSYEYKFYQGNTSESAELVPSTCATNGKRTITISDNVMLDPVCFSACSSCSSISSGSVTAVTSTPKSLTDFSYTIANAPATMSIANNVVSWTPASTETSSGQVTLTVSNVVGYSTELFKVAVSAKLVTNIVLSQNALSLTPSSSAVTLAATVLPSDAANSSLAWTSSNTAVATVSNGKITAVGVGTTTITATAKDGSGKSAMCIVTVSNILVSSIVLSEESLTLTLSSSSVFLVASISPMWTLDKTVTWTSSNRAVAIVENGIVTAVGYGSATIIATADDGSGISSVCTVNVQKTLAAGDEERESASVYPTPAKNDANLCFGEAGDTYDIAIVNSQGRCVRKYAQVPGGKTRVKRGELSSGVYYFIASKDGVALVKGKIVFE